MEMTIHLDPDIYEIVKNGTKNIEVRLNDEKRRKLTVGDTLIFLKRPDDSESIKAKIISLDYYKDFKELVDNYDMSRLYDKNYTKEEFLQLLERFYSLDDQKEYGTVAIGFQLL